MNTGLLVACVFLVPISVAGLAYGAMLIKKQTAGLGDLLMTGVCFLGALASSTCLVTVITKFAGG